MVNKSKIAEKPSTACKMKKAQKRPERFKILKRSSSCSSLFHMSQIEWKNITQDLVKPLLVTIPRTAGNAVLRNRWKRIIKEWHRSEGLSISPRQSLWIRFNRNKKLSQPIQTQDWAPFLSQEVKKFNIYNLS
jgi:ribonuclease P protein component